MLCNTNEPKRLGSSIERRGLELRCHRYRGEIMHCVFVGILWTILSVISMTVANTVLYPPKISPSATVFLFVLLLSLD